MERLAEYLAQQRDRQLVELDEFLRSPSISALSEHRADVRTSATWLAAKLNAIGVPRTAIMETGGNPVVYGEWMTDPGKPTIIVYGHYDVQPVDPLGLWDSPPFEPTLRDNRLYARGASDDKGNLMMSVFALEALAELDGEPPLNVKFLFEGEEEVGSPHLPQFMKDNAELLAADIAVSADGGLFHYELPSITVGSRGLAALQLNVRGPKGDLHSGRHGGAIQNPIHALAELLASMRSPDGKILVEGFYDGVDELSPEERDELARVPFDEPEYMETHGVDELFGEPGYSTLERRWVRPTLEVNGIWGGFQGEGTKTVLPSEAHAKLSCRLVPHQDPEQVLDALEAHVKRHCPPGVIVDVDRPRGGAPAYLIPPEHPAVQAAATVLGRVFEREPVFVRMGGTLPVAELFKRLLDVPLVFFAFGDPDTNIHAPNEFLRMVSFDRGVRATALYYRVLGGLSL